MKSRAIRCCCLVLIVGGLGSLPARANAPAGRYTYTATSVTVYDNKTKLTWQRAAAPSSMMWMAAKTYCANSVAAALGGANWRLPTLKELQTLVDYSMVSGLVAQIDPTAFPATPRAVFWSASPFAGQSTYAWDTDFSDGTTNFNDATFLGNVRCVR